MFRQKQANMKREMKQDYQNYIKQSQNIDARKQKIMKQRQATEDAGYFPGDQIGESFDKKRSQIADEVFNEIMSGKAKGKNSLPSKIGYSKASPVNTA